MRLTRLPKCLAGIALSLSIAAGRVYAGPDEVSLEKILQANAVMVYQLEHGTPKLCGTATLVDEGRLMVTNRHVISPEDCLPTNYKTSTSQKWHPGEEMYVRYDEPGAVPDADLVAFPVEGASKGFGSYVMFDDLTTGEPIFTLGNRECQPWSFSKGAVAHLWRAEDPNRDQRVDSLLAALQRRQPIEGLEEEKYAELIMSTKFAASGNSGGPVVDRYGRLMGIIYASAPDFDLVLPIKGAMATMNIAVQTASVVQEKSTAADRELIASVSALRGHVLSPGMFEGSVLRSVAGVKPSVTHTMRHAGQK
ncbi:hypothetical protein BH09SUM1_BH09SUM1_25500 [soil metagenome]